MSSYNIELENCVSEKYITCISVHLNILCLICILLEIMLNLFDIAWI